MISKELLDILVCPENHTRLELADDRLIAYLNQAIEEGRLTNRGGEKIGTPLDGGLVRADGRVLYPIIDEIPVMLLDEAIELDAIERSEWDDA